MSEKALTLRGLSEIMGEMWKGQILEQASRQRELMKLWYPESEEQRRRHADPVWLLYRDKALHLSAREAVLWPEELDRLHAIIAAPAFDAAKDAGFLDHLMEKYGNLPEQRLPVDYDEWD
jgi:hypothetical protein